MSQKDNEEVRRFSLSAAVSMAMEKLVSLGAVASDSPSSSPTDVSNQSIKILADWISTQMGGGVVACAISTSKKSTKPTIDNIKKLRRRKVAPLSPDPSLLPPPEELNWIEEPPPFVTELSFFPMNVNDDSPTPSFEVCPLYEAEQQELEQMK